MCAAASPRTGLNIDIHRQISEVRDKISTAFASYQHASDRLQQQIELWTRKYEARRTGSYRALRQIASACRFAEQCLSRAEQVRSPVFICQDVELVLAAHGLKADGSIIVLDLVEAPPYRVRWNRLDQPTDPFVHALDRATASLLSLVDIAMVASKSLATELENAGVRTIVVPDYPPARHFDRAPGIKAACRLRTQDRLVLLFDRVEAGFSAPAIISALGHLPEDFHIAIIGDCGDAPSARYERELDEYLAATGLHGRVHLSPPVASEQLPSFAGSADVGVIGLDPADIGQRLLLPSALFDCIAARLPVAAGALPEVQRVLCFHKVGAQFDRAVPRSIAECAAALAQAKGRLLPRLNLAAQQLVWSRNEVALLGLFPGVAAVTILRAETIADQSRTNRIAATLLDHGIAVTIARPVIERGAHAARTGNPLGAKYIDIPIDI